MSSVMFCKKKVFMLNKLVYSPYQPVQHEDFTAPLDKFRKRGSSTEPFFESSNPDLVIYLVKYSDLTRPGPPKGSVLEGKWDPLFQGNLAW